MAAAGSRQAATAEVGRALYLTEQGAAVAAGINTGDAARDAARLQIATRQEELLAYKKPDVTGEDLLQAALELRNKPKESEKPFDAKAQKEAREKFGGGRAERDSLTGKAQKEAGTTTTKIDSAGLEPGEEDSIRETVDKAELAIDTADTFLRYTGALLYIQSESPKAGADPALIKAEAYRKHGFVDIPGGLTAEQQFKKAREDSLKHLLKDQTVIAIIQDSEAFGSMNDDQKQEAIELLVVSDPTLREKVHTKLQEALAVKLPDVIEDTWDATEAKKTAAETALTTQVAQIDAHMRAKVGIAPDVSVFKTMLEGGKTADEILEEYKKIVLEGAEITPETEGVIAAYNEIQNAIKEKEAKKAGANAATIAGLDAEIVQLKTKAEEEKNKFKRQSLKEKGYNDDQVDALMEVDAAKAAVAEQDKKIAEAKIADPGADTTEFEAEKTRLQESYTSEGGDIYKKLEAANFDDITDMSAHFNTLTEVNDKFDQAKKDYDAVQKVVGETNDVDADGDTSIKKIISDAVKAAKVKKDAEEELTPLGSKDVFKVAVMESRLNRAAAERALVEKMESVFAEGFVATLDARIKEQRVLEQMDVEKKNAEDKAKGDVKKAEIRSELQRKLNEQYVSYDENTGTKNPNRAHIMADMRYLMARGEDPEQVKEAVLRMMLRDSGLIPLDAYGRQTSTPPIDWKNDDLSTLEARIPGFKLDTLQALIPEMQPKYMNKILTSFTTERNVLDKVGGLFGKGGDMALQPHEWRMLEKTFGSQVQGRIEENAAAKAFTKKLEQAGIKVDTKMGLWILLALLGGVALPVVGLPAILAAGGAAAAVPSLLENRAG